MFLLKLLNKAYQDKKSIIKFFYKKDFYSLFYQCLEKNIDLNEEEKRYLFEKIKKEKHMVNEFRDLFFTILGGKNKLDLNLEEIYQLFDHFNLDFSYLFFQSAKENKFDLTEEQINSIIDKSTVKEFLLKEYTYNQFDLTNQQINLLLKEIKTGDIILIGYIIFQSQKLNEDHLVQIINKVNDFNLVFINYMAIENANNLSNNILIKIIDNIYYIKKENNQYYLNKEQFNKEFDKKIETYNELYVERSNIVENIERLLENINLGINVNNNIEAKNFKI